jgi:SAM-dependent methyltransferase
MDRATDQFYRAYAERLQAQQESPRSAMMALAERFFRPGDVVLDVGAGSGRDTAALRALGVAAVGVEPNDAMRARAIAAHPDLLHHLRPGGLPDLGQPFADRYPDGFDGVVCSAVLMHIEPTALAQALHALAFVLRPSTSRRVPGASKRSALADRSTLQDRSAQRRTSALPETSASRETAASWDTSASLCAPATQIASAAAPQHLLLSLPEMAPDRLIDHRDPDDRLFFNHAPQHVIELLQPHGLTLCVHEISDAVLAATGTRWHSLAFARQP